VNQPPTPILDPKEVNVAKPVISESKNKFLKIGVIIVIVLVIILAGLVAYQKVVAPAIAKPSPTPIATDPIWKSKSQSNVNNFLDLWTKSIGTTNSDEYAIKARDYLTVTAQAKILTYVDNMGNSINNVSLQLTNFVGSPAPESYSISEVTQIDEKTVDISVTFVDETTSTKIFTTKSENEVWLINSARNWGE